MQQNEKYSFFVYPTYQTSRKNATSSKKKKREITNVNIHSISSTALKQIASALTKPQSGKKLNNNNQQQPPPEHRILEKKPHSESSNRINFPDQAQNFSEKNSTCEEMTKLHLKYQQHLLQISKILQTLLTDGLSFTTEKKQHQHNTPNTNVALLIKNFLLLQNNKTSLPHNNNNYYNPHLTTHAKKICNCAESKKIANLYKKILLDVWNSLETLYTEIDTPSCKKQKKQKNDTSLYPNNSGQTNNFQKTVSEDYIMTNTQLYGKIKIKKVKNNKITKIKLHQHEVALTQEEINNQYKEQFPINLDENQMFRCPLKSCNHKPLNTYFIEPHLLQHCQIYHNDDKKQYIFRYQTQYGKKKIHYPPIF